MFIAFVIVVILSILAPISNSSKPHSLDKLPSDVLRHISEFFENPSRELGSLCKTIRTAFPSAKHVIACKFNCNSFQNLPSTPELWHFYRFRGTLNNLILDYQKFLPETARHFAEAVVSKLQDGSLQVSQNELEKFFIFLDQKKFSDLYVYLHSILPNLNTKSFEVPQLDNNIHHIIGNIITISSLTVEEKLQKIQDLQLSSGSLFSNLLKAIAHLPFQLGLEDEILSLMPFINPLLCSRFLCLTVQLMIKLKFDSFSINPQEYQENINHLKGIGVTEWTNTFVLVAIEVARIDVLRMLLSALESKLSPESQSALIKHPEILSLLDEQVLMKCLGLNFIDYRKFFDDENFDKTKKIITADDLIVSGYKHRGHRFRQVLKRFPFHEFVQLSQIIEKFFDDIQLIDNLKLISQKLEIKGPYPSYILSAISFPVLRFMILNYENFKGIFQNEIIEFSLLISPEVMAQILRDNQVYNELKIDSQKFFKRFFFSFPDAIPLFTEYDWNRLFALSSVPFNFIVNNNHEYLLLTIFPYCNNYLSTSLDRFKSNFADFVFWETSAPLIYSSLEKYLIHEPLLSIWRKNDPSSFAERFETYETILFNTK